MAHKETMTAQVWKRLMIRYSILMVVGVVIIISIIPSVKSGAETWNMIILLLGGLGIFGGFFGLAVSLFFHLWHGKASE
ncbi:MAG: hypothetical protein Q9M15_02335 [Mariprofundaceae bacterium]|nr:hypothetical protein [Mariprofundaceae bacterium]